MRFWLGTHETSWLGLLGVPLFVSRRRLALRKGLPRARAPWVLDSGGFSELSLFGAWQTTPAQYVAEARRYRDEIGLLEGAACQDWMCEPFMLRKTGLSIGEHQLRSTASYLELRALAPDVPWFPVLQGWRESDYLRHVEMYAAFGVDLAALPLVGVGSVCRRQATGEALAIFERLSELKIRLHGFGLKVEGLRRAARLLESADSMAWSFAARRSPPMAGCRHRSCANCARYALRWRDGVLSVAERALAQPYQLSMRLDEEAYPCAA